MDEKVTILMAIYKPNIKWLEEQLDSLNNQTYSNLELLVWNDCPEDNTNYEAFYNEHITNFPYKIFPGEKNLGSNGAFEELTKLATSKYVAYCDQDDIWLPEKMEILVDEARISDAYLLCSDMYVIDGNGVLVSDSISNVRPHHTFVDKNNNFTFLLARNFVTGCTTLVKTDMAKKSLPFPKEFVHDWWLAIYAAAFGKIKILKKPLIKYRIHGNNQTGTLMGVSDKTSYYYKRIQVLEERANVVHRKFCNSNYKKVVDEFRLYVDCRLAYHKKTSLSNAVKFWKLRHFNPMTTYFELLLPFMPSFVFRFLINQIRKGNI